VRRNVGKKSALVLVAATVVATTGLAGSAVAADAPSGTPGALSAGDRLFPELGNGGYEAGSYDVRFDYRPGTMLMDSSVRMTATATQDLSRFGLDAVGQTIRSVSVDGIPATFRTSGEKLIITPKRTLRSRRVFTVRTDYRADRSKNPPSPAFHLPPGTDWPLENWVNTKDGFALMGQPDRAHLFFPCNDHPSDKARFTFQITTPRDVEAVANGTLVSRREAGGRTTYTYRTRNPIPTDITQVAVGRFREIRQVGPHGLPVRSYVPADQYAKIRPAVERTPGQIAWVEKTLGRPFPFEAYGVLGVNSDYNGVALETATLSTFGARGFAAPAKDMSPLMAHELTHQYFGDAVSVRSWDDMWLSEGHAAYYHLRYAADQGYINLDQTMRKFYEDDAQQRADNGPAGRMKHAANVYFDADIPGALMLYGLHNLVGDATFRHIDQAFFDEYRGRSATTRDFVDVANRVSGRDLTGYINAWLYGDKTPPMPGHPDWKSAPAKNGK
jgi:aminopeptidase N